MSRFKIAVHIRSRDGAHTEHHKKLLLKSNEKGLMLCIMLCLSGNIAISGFFLYSSSELKTDDMSCWTKEILKQIPTIQFKVLIRIFYATDTSDERSKVSINLHNSF